MAKRLFDLKLWAYTPYEEGSQEFWADISLYNYVCDLYVQKMYGYKPPQTQVILLRAWTKDATAKPNRVNEYAAVSLNFNYNQFAVQDQRGRYLHVLNVIQDGIMQLCKALDWDQSVFERAYKDVIDAGFAYRKNFPAKSSKDRKTSAALFIEKSPLTTSVFIEMIRDGSTTIVKLFDKKNQWCSDGTYILCRFGKWFAKNSFGIYYNQGIIDIRYSLHDGTITFTENGVKVPAIDIDRHFKMRCLRAYGPTLLSQ